MHFIIFRYGKQEQLVSDLLNELSRLTFVDGFSPKKIAWAICDGLRLKKRFRYEC